MFPFDDDFTLDRYNYTPEQLRERNLFEEINRIMGVRDSTQGSLVSRTSLDLTIPFNQTEIQSSTSDQQIQEIVYNSTSETYTIITQDGDQIELPKEFYKYIFKGKLGNGGFSSVVLVNHIEKNMDFAAKIFPSNIVNDPEKSKFIFNEVNFLKKVDNPYVIKYVESFSIVNKYEEKYFVIILEYCKYGSMTNYVLTHEVDDSEFRSILFKICQAIEYLHNSCGISHNDIKPDNILIDENLNPKISDFGFAQNCTISSGKDSFFTLEYAAPEVLRNEKYNMFMADIWSLGVTLYGLKTKKLPFVNTIPYKDQILNGKLLLDRSDALQNLVWKCTQLKPEDRITILEILYDAYFSTT